MAPIVAMFDWALITVGLVYLVTQSTIFSPLRKVVSKAGIFFEVLIYCPACSGFWLGGLASAWLQPSGIETLLQAAIKGAALGALWGVYGPESPWNIEMERSDAEKAKASD